MFLHRGLISKIKTMKITAIQVDTQPVRWVASTYQRGSGMYGVIYTEIKNEAKDFGNRVKAIDVVNNIHNPLNRVFSIVEIEVSKPRKIKDIMEDMQ